MEVLATPPKYFKDRLEFSPVIRCSNSQAYARKEFETIFSSPDYFEEHRAHFPAVSTFNQFSSYAKRHELELLKRFENNIALVDADTEDNVLEMVSQSHGVICLSHDGLIAKMWEAYASSHTGLVVEFPQDHLLFTGQSFLEVEYSDERVSYDASAASDHERVRQFIRRKRTQYSHEQESRLIVPLDLTREEPTDRGPFYFLPVGPELVIPVTLGWQVTPQLKKDVLVALEDKFSDQVALYEVRPGNSSQLVRVPAES